MGNVVLWTVERLAQLVLHSAASFFGWTVKGGVIAVLAKVAAAILFLGLAAAGLGWEDLAGALFILSAAPVMLIGLWIMVRAPFLPAKKKKKKK